MDYLPDNDLILFIASFNTISSLSLLLLEKKADMNTLQRWGLVKPWFDRCFSGKEFW
jgi:ABC-type lipoprotein release transport system permease subunit